MITLFYIVGVLYIIISVIVAIVTAQNGLTALWNGFAGVVSGALFIAVADLMSRVGFLQQELKLYQIEKKKDTLPQTTCWRCGKNYDFDYPQCPHCKAQPGEGEEP